MPNESSLLRAVNITSIDRLEGLMSEVQQLQTFLKSEVERVQHEIESALAGIKIIIETIAPSKAMSVPTTPARPFRAVATRGCACVALTSPGHEDRRLSVSISSVFAARTAQ
jgi:hypothetical protein